MVDRICEALVAKKAIYEEDSPILCRVRATQIVRATDSQVSQIGQTTAVALLAYSRLASIGVISFLSF
jgi:hypothetical protein